MRTANVARRADLAGNSVWLMTTSGGLQAFRKLGTDLPHMITRAAVLGRREAGITSRLWSYVLSSVHGALLALRAGSFDWVYSDSDYPCDVLPALVFKRVKNAQWVAMLHHVIRAELATTSRTGSVKRRLQRWAHRLVAEHADMVFCYATKAGDDVVAELVELGMDPDRIRRVHNGFDSRELRSVAASSVYYDACLVGGLRAGKGLQDIVPIWSSVCSRMPAARLAIVGALSSANRRQLERQISSAGLQQNIFILGPRTHAEAIAQIKACAIMLSASWEEGWGIAVCEALACGIPVAAYDLPVYRSLFRGGMRCVRLADTGKLADSVVELLSDKAERARLAAEAPLAVADYEWNQVASRDLAFLEIS